MLCELGAAALVGAGMFGGGAAGDAVGVVGVVTLGGGMGSGAVGAPFCIFALFADVAIFLAFIASDGLLSVLGDDYPGIRNENTLRKEVVSCNGGSTEDFDICCFLVGSSMFGFLDPQGCYDGAFFEIML